MCMCIMARGWSRRIEQITFILVVIVCQVCTEKQHLPEFKSLSVISYNNSLDNKQYEIVFDVRGENIYRGIQIKTTTKKARKNTLCEEDLKIHDVADISELRTSPTEARYLLRISKSVCGNVYLCLPEPGDGILIDEGEPPNVLGKRLRTWYHQGENVSFALDATANCDDVQLGR